MSSAKVTAIMENGDVLAARDYVLAMIEHRDGLIRATNAVVEGININISSMLDMIKAQGFALGGYPVMQQETAGIDYTDPQNWVVGTVVRRISKRAPEVYTYGQTYEVVEVGGDYIHIRDNFWALGWTDSSCQHTPAAAAELFEFVSDPVK